MATAYAHLVLMPATLLVNLVNVTHIDSLANRCMQL